MYNHDLCFLKSIKTSRRTSKKMYIIMLIYYYKEKNYFLGMQGGWNEKLIKMLKLKT